MKNLIKVMKALSDKNRIRLIKMHEIRSLYVCEITFILQLANSTVSKHLSLLKDADLIVDEKDGKWVQYRLNQEKETPYVTQLLSLLSNWLPEDQTITSDRRKVEKTDRTMLCRI